MTGNTELREEAASLLDADYIQRNNRRIFKDDNDHQDALLDSLMHLFQRQIEEEVRECRLRVIDKVFELSPKESFNNWKPTDAFRFYERLKAYESELKEERLK